MLSHMRRILLGFVVLAIILNGIAFARVSVGRPRFLH
jgi:hypothetical protein